MHVRNKCYLQKGDPTNENTNWTRTSSMESDLILGFLASEKQHGVYYNNFVENGDSSVYPTLISNVPKWDHPIKKQECANHALKCC